MADEGDVVGEVGVGVGNGLGVNAEGFEGEGGRARGAMDKEVLLRLENYWVASPQCVVQIEGNHFYRGGGKGEGSIHVVTF